MSGREKYVAYVDMMGFSQMVDAEPDLLEASPEMLRALGADFEWSHAPEEERRGACQEFCVWGIT